MVYVYMIKNSANLLYIGITEDPDARVHYHNQKRGAGFTKHIPTYKTVFLEQHPALAEARKREIQVKKWRREKKDVLIKRYQKSLPTKVDL